MCTVNSCLLLMSHTSYFVPSKSQNPPSLKCTHTHTHTHTHAQLLQSQRGADRMVRLLDIYQEEDVAYQDLVTTATVFFQYLLQPFRDMRELACLYKMEILVHSHSAQLHQWLLGYAYSRCVLLNGIAESLASGHMTYHLTHKSSTDYADFAS